MVNDLEAGSAQGIAGPARSEWSRLVGAAQETVKSFINETRHESRSLTSALFSFGGKLAETGTSAPASRHRSTSGGEEGVPECFAAVFNFSF